MFRFVLNVWPSPQGLGLEVFLNLINLAPLFVARHMVSQVLEAEGIEAFALEEPDGGPVFRLDPDAIDEVVELARLEVEARRPWLRSDAQALDLCRRFVRRCLIYEMAVGMVDSGR